MSRSRADGWPDTRQAYPEERRAPVGKTPGFTPEGVTNEMRRTGRYTEADFRRIASYRQSIPAATMVRLREIPGEAEVEISAAMVEHYR